jgi:hypothetical protein
VIDCGDGVRDNLRTPRRVGGQDARKSKQMKARRGDQDRECFDQLQRIQHEMRRAIASGRGKRVHKLALRAVR